MENIEKNKLSGVRSKKFWKFWIMMLLINIGLFTVVGRLFWIQVVKGSDYKEKARKQHESKITLSAQRGNVYDRNGKLLASTVKSFSVAVDPTVLENKQKICSILEKNTGTPQSKFLDKINSAKGSFVWLSRGLSPDKIFELRALKDKGLLLIEEPTRHYYYSSAASQLIGCTDIDNKGQSGIEFGWDSVLKGRSGYMIMYRDGRGRLRPSADLPIIAATHGYSIQLTIDIELQRIAEFELMQGVLSSQAESGTVIALEPSTGEVLAMASYPNFDPNNSSTFTQHNMRNRAITDVYEPGSTFKMITAAAALEENVAKLTDKFNGFGGEMQFANYTIKDVHPLGIVTFREAMEHSSNIIMSTIASKIPEYKFYKYIRDFGFGISTGIDIPGEVPGKIQKPEQMNMTAKRFIGFGYGLLSSPIQIANAYATIANNGLMMKPHVVKAVYDNSGEKILNAKPEKVRKVVTESTAQLMKDVLLGVVDKGTGQTAKIPGLKIGGKTGTSQQLVEGTYSKADYTASFVGFYPVENPRVVMLVLLDKPRTNIYGGSVAAPIFKNIALRWLSVAPDYMPNLDKKVQINDTVYVPELKGLSIDEAQKISQSLGLRLAPNQSSGIINSVAPPAGARVIKGTTLKVSVQIPKDSTKNSKQPAKPNLIGLPVRRAVALLHNLGIKARIKGNGKVIAQYWELNSKGEEICILECSQ